MRRAAAGYTLLELVVVLGILAMATALAAPPSYRMVRSWQEATQVDDALQQLAHLPGVVRDSGTPLSVDRGQPITLLTLPEGWHVEMLSPLHIQANGACNSADGELHTAAQTLPFRLHAPFCRVERVSP